MTTSSAEILMLKGAVSELTAVQQEKFKDVAQLIRDAVADGDALHPGVGLMALALIGMEAGG